VRTVRSIIRHSLGGAVTFCIGLVIVMLIGGSAFLLQRTRHTSVNAADASIQNAALIVESVVNRQLLQVDGALVSLPALFATVTKEGQPVTGQSAGRLLRALNFQTFAFRDIILLRPDGTIWASARPNPWNGNFPMKLLQPADGAPGGTALVAGPVRNVVTGDWVLLLMRKLSIPGVGALDAVAEVPLSLITVLFSAVGEIPGLRIALERSNGQLLVSQPYDETLIGKQQPIVISRVRADGVSFIVPSDLIRTPTLGVARATLYPGVVVALTLNLDIAMEDWIRDRNRMIGMVALAVLLLSALILTLNSIHRQRDRADADRRKAGAILDSAIESMSDGFVMWDADDRLVTCNRQFRDMYAFSAEYIRPGERFEDIIRGGALLGQYPQAMNDIDKFVGATVEWHHHNEGPMERELPNGRWALITERRTPDGGSVGIRTDITDMKLAISRLATANDRARDAMAEAQSQNVALRERDRELHIQNMLFDAALNNMSQGLLMTDGKQNLIVYNKRFLDLFAIDPSALAPGLPTIEIFEHMAATGGLSTASVKSIYTKQRDLAAAGQSGTFIVTGECDRSISISQRPIAEGGWIATYEDVSEQRRAEAHIRFAAHHDALTKLPNRVLFRIRLDEMIKTLSDGDPGLALLYLDLDRFKQVNDTLGHPVGDALLEAAGQRLLNCLRDSDIVARLGGDEFAIAYLSADLPTAAEDLARRVISALSLPYEIAGHTVMVGVSIGIALVGAETMDADTLLKNADMALYEAKAKGRGISSVFEADMERKLHSRLAIEEDLRGALERDEFELLYQPLWDLGTNRVVGFEALVRWNHPVRGTVSPALFIQVAEETGLIRPIGQWILNRACADARHLPDDVKVAVNLSGAQFDGGDIVDIVAGALDGAGLAASRLELEITETTLLKNDETTLALLFRLRALGIRIALDDFGTGYSSLSYLRRFPFDKIKIDQSFVREMATRADCAAIVGSIVSLANKLDITTTAEGIETVDQLNLIRATGCTEAQGHLFSVPRSIRDVLEYFAESSSSTGCMLEVDRASWIHGFSQAAG
jgi:diguanylate cyclase (GGDEF)-like protein